MSVSLHCSLSSYLSISREVIACVDKGSTLQVLAPKSTFQFFNCPSFPSVSFTFAVPPQYCLPCATKSYRLQCIFFPLLNFLHTVASQNHVLIYQVPLPMLNSKSVTQLFFSFMSLFIFQTFCPTCPTPLVLYHICLNYCFATTV